MGNSDSSNPGGFSAQAKALFSRADKFHSTTVRTNAARWELNDRASNQGAMREAAKLGFTGMEVARGRGGLGLGVREKLRVAEILGRSSLSFALGLLATQNVAVRLAQYGSARHRADVLPGLLAGTRFGAVAMPGQSGGGTALGKPSLVAQKESDRWELTGRSDWMINAAVSDVFVCYADTGTRGAPEDLACFVVRAGQVGFKQSSPYRLIAGSPMGVGGFELKNYHCLDSDMLIAPGEAARGATIESNCERLQIAVLVCSAMRSSLAAVVDNIDESVTIIDGGLADVVTKLEAAEALTASSVDLFCQDPAHSRTSAAVRAAKSFACEAAESSLSSSLRNLGRQALHDSDPLGRLIAECRVLTELSGSTADLRTETLERLPVLYSSTALEESTVTSRSFVQLVAEGPETQIDLRSTSPTTPSVAVPAGQRSTEPKRPATTAASTSIPPMPPSDKRLSQVGSAATPGGAASAPPDSDEPPAMPPMPPPEMKRASS